MILIFEAQICAYFLGKYNYVAQLLSIKKKGMNAVDIDTRFKRVFK